MTENTINNKDEKYSPMLKFLSNEISSSNLWRIEWLHIMLIAIVIDLLAIRVFGIPKSITFLLSAYLIASSAESVGGFSTEEQHKLSNDACFPGFAYQESLDISHLQIEKGRLMTLQAVSKRSLA